MATAAAAATASSSAKQFFLSKGLPFVTKPSMNAYAPTGKWILATGGMVVGMIHVGGVTRLTQSGLSMTSWTPLGSLPPMNQAEWQDEFERYKKFPEWQQRRSMTVEEFKFIYFWEYGHRMLGRLVGVAFAVPWLYFTVRGKIPKGHQKRMVGLLAMGGSQGLIGWWMVKSGLGEDRRDDKKEIRVKPVRLATHLTMALATYGALLWTGFDILSLPHEKTSALREQVAKLTNKDVLKKLSRLRAGSFALVGLTAVTVTSGALVAGNDAGRAYNTFPKMDESWIPPEILELEPWTRDLIENTATVQWNHRVLGTATAATALSLAAAGLSPGRASALLLTPQAKRGLYAVGLAATGQFALGVTTLLHYVPLSLAAAHQLGSLVVFTSGLYLAHSLRYAAARPALLARAAASTATAARGSVAAKAIKP